VLSVVIGAAKLLGCSLDYRSDAGSRCETCHNNNSYWTISCESARSLPMYTKSVSHLRKLEMWKSTMNVNILD